MKFCLKITSMWSLSYEDVINKYPCLGDEKYKLCIKRVWCQSLVKDHKTKRDIIYITISSIKAMAELIDCLGTEVIIGVPDKFYDNEHYTLEIYDDYRE